MKFVAYTQSMTLIILFIRVCLTFFAGLYTVSSESPGEYFDSLVDRAHVHKKSAARLVKNSDSDMVTDLETTSEELEAERELACLVELSDAAGLESLVNV